MSDINKTLSSVSPYYNAVKEKSSLSQKGVNGLVKTILEESSHFSEDDLVSELKKARSQGYAIDKRGQKAPAEKVFLENLAYDINKAGVIANQSASVGKAYNYLLKNQNNLNQVYDNMQKQMVGGTASEINSNEKTYHNTPLTPIKSNYESSVMRPNNYNVPSGNVSMSINNSMPYHQQMPLQKPSPKFEISNPSPTYQLAATPDIFSSPKTGSSAVYQIVPFDLIAGA